MLRYCVMFGFATLTTKQTQTQQATVAGARTPPVHLTICMCRNTSQQFVGSQVAARAHMAICKCRYQTIQEKCRSLANEYGINNLPVRAFRSACILKHQQHEKQTDTPRIDQVIICSRKVA